MEELRTVVLYGNSLYVAGLEACLKGKPGLDVVRVDATLPDPGQRLKDLCPDVIILDLAAPDSEFAIPFLRKYPGLSVIDLDIASDTVVVFSTQQYTALSANDLAQVIWTPIRPQN